MVLLKSRDSRTRNYLIASLALYHSATVFLCIKVFQLDLKHGRIPRGDRGPEPPENHKHIGFLCNTGPDPLKNHKATKPAFNFGPASAHQRNAI